MILAAGEGTRLRPLTLNVPKVLLPVGGVPLIKYTLSWLKKYNILEVAINLYHLGDKIKAFLGNGSDFGMKIIYSEEETLLGSAGGVKRMEHFFDDTFLVFYGDVLADFDLSDMIEFHRIKKAIATLAVFEVTNQQEVGVAKMAGDGKISGLIEKPKTTNSQSPVLANGGIYILEREVMDYIPDQCFSDFAYDIIPKLIDLQLPVYGYCLTSEDYLIDIGTMDKYHEANSNTIARRMKVKYG